MADLAAVWDAAARTLAITALVCFVSAGVLWWKLRWTRYGTRLTSLTARIFVAWGLYQAAAIGVLYLVFHGLVSTPVHGILAGLMFFPAFVAAAEMWRVLTVIMYGDLVPYWTWIVGYGGALVGAGLLVFAGVLPFPWVYLLAAVGMVVLGVALGVMGLQSARAVPGEGGAKLAFFTLGAVFALIGSQIAVALNAVGPFDLPGQAMSVLHLVFAAFFLIAVFWGEIEDVKW